jgi:hypothetical protein
VSRRPIIDAGPSLNFFAANKERILISVLGELSAPETVKQEVQRKASVDQRFARAITVWRKLEPKWVEILPDDVTPPLSAAVQRICRVPMAERLRERKDLGELMVLAHAAVFAEAGEDVTVLIDDGGGVQLANAEAARLTRRRTQGQSVGSITVVGTLTILEAAAGRSEIPDKATMANVYSQLEKLDDGLPSIGTTRLLSSEVWSFPGI